VCDFRDFHDAGLLREVGCVDCEAKGVGAGCEEDVVRYVLRGGAVKGGFEFLERQRMERRTCHSSRGFVMWALCT